MDLLCLPQNYHVFVWNRTVCLKAGIGLLPNPKVTLVKVCFPFLADHYEAFRVMRLFSSYFPGVTLQAF